MEKTTLRQLSVHDPDERAIWSPPPAAKRANSVGVIGALLGGFLLGLLGISAGGLLGSLVTATVGAVVLIALLRAIKK